MRLAKHHIRTWYRQSTRLEFDEGRAWYDDAYKVCVNIASDYNMGIDTVVGVLAALSPRNHWERNVADCEALCKWYRTTMGGIRGESPKVATFDCNKRTALRILDGVRPLDALHGRKVRSFYLCITGDPEEVCVDTWAIRAATNGKVSAVANDGQYRKVQEAYRAVAKEFGLKPYELQAIVWVTIRNAS